MNEQMLTPIQNAHTNPTLEFRDGQAVLRSKTLAGTVQERLVSYEQIKEAAIGLPVDSGWLGPEIVRWGNGRIGEWLVAFFPPTRHQLELTTGTPGESESTVKIVAPLPGLVMFGGGVSYYIWAQKSDHCDPHAELFRCPLPNVYQDAKICWGPFKPPQASPKGIIRAFEIFIGSTFTNHAANGKSKSHPEDVRELLKNLAGGEPQVYPLDDLIRQVDGTGVTLDKAIREFWKVGEMPG